MRGRFSWVSTAITPPTFMASLMSMRAIRPFAIVDVTTLPKARFGALEFPGVFRRPGDLVAPVDAGGGSPDVSGHWHAHAIFLLDIDCGVPRAACVSARMMARRARSILNVL